MYSTQERITKIYTTRGGRQGRSLSPILFNMYDAISGNYVLTNK